MIFGNEGFFSDGPWVVGKKFERRGLAIFGEGLAG